MVCKSSILPKMRVKAKNDSQFPGDIILMYSLEDRIYLAAIELKQIIYVNRFNCVIYPPAGGCH